MCIYLYSPGNEIQLDYVVENIRLIKKGSIHIVIDLLVTNKSDNDIKSVNILFPHALTEVVDDEGDQGPKVVSNSYFKDITLSYFDDYSIHNKALYQSGREIKWESKKELGNSSLKIIIPDPNNPVNDIDYYGQIKGNSTLKIQEDLSIIEHTILSELDIAYLKCEFESELKKDKARWFRWEFRPINASKDYYSPFTYWFNYLSYKLNYRYEVVGPIDVKERFSRKLGCFYKECSKSQVESKRKLIFIADSLQKKIEINGFKHESTNTKYEDWRISLFPADYKEIVNLSTHGDISSCGITPNYIDYFENPVINNVINPSLQGEHCYQYKGGRRNCDKPEGIFSISFMAVYTSTFRGILGFLSFLLAILAIILSLILHFTQ